MVKGCVVFVCVIVFMLFCVESGLSVVVYRWTFEFVRGVGFVCVIVCGFMIMFRCVVVFICRLRLRGDCVYVYI